MKFRAIMAMDKNGTIGNGLDLPWAGDKSTKWDMDNFKALTSNHIVIMGYNTFKGFKRPLKNRLNLVIGRPQEGEKFYSLKESVPDIQKVGNNFDANMESTIEFSSGESYPTSNKVDMTKNELSTLFNFIPLETIDYRFVYIPKEVLTDKTKRNFSFDHLNRNFNAARDITVDNYKNSGMNDDSIAKLKKMDLDTAYIIGGANTYYRYMNLIDEFIITRFDNEYPGDIKFDLDSLNKFNKKDIIFSADSGEVYCYHNNEKTPTFEDLLD